MREPTIDEISLYLEIPANLVIEAVNSSIPIHSLDETITIDDTFSLYELIPSKTENIDESLLLDETMQNLNETEANIIRLRYFNDCTQAETAEIMATNQTQISRQEQKILLKMRSNLK